MVKSRVKRIHDIHGVDKTVGLNNVQVAEHLSEETIAFTCELWVDGQQIGFVRNDGRGGANIIRPLMVNGVSTNVQIKNFVEWCKTQPPCKVDMGNDFDNGYLDMDADLFIGLMVEDVLFSQNNCRYEDPFGGPCLKPIGHDGVHDDRPNKESI